MRILLLVLAVLAVPVHVAAQAEVLDRPVWIMPGRPPAQIRPSEVILAELATCEQQLHSGGSHVAGAVLLGIVGALSMLGGGLGIFFAGFPLEGIPSEGGVVISALVAVSGIASVIGSIALGVHGNAMKRAARDRMEGLQLELQLYAGGFALRF